MGIFKKLDRSSINPADTTIIASGTKIEGVLQGDGKVHVDGEFSGPVDSKGIITVGKNGVIKGHVAAEKLIVCGDFSGTADCEEIHILPGGKVVGQIVSKIFVIDRGGIFNGQNRLKGSSVGNIDRVRDDSPLITMHTASGNVTRISEASKTAQTVSSGF